VASANLELVRSIYAAWQRGDYSSVEWADPEIEYVFADGPTPNLLHIRDGKVTRLVIYFDRERALADVGPAREGSSPGS
jgi:ketosteroid isomerase-like protein